MKPHELAVETLTYMQEVLVGKKNNKQTTSAQDKQTSERLAARVSIYRHVCKRKSRSSALPKHTLRRVVWRLLFVNFQRRRSSI